jgi:cell shape-determining protein MreC
MFSLSLSLTHTHTHRDRVRERETERERGAELRFMENRVQLLKQENKNSKIRLQVVPIFQT